MKKLLSLFALGLVLSFGAHAAEGDAKTPQQTRMATCNKEAGEKKGDERKAFMSECLKAKPQSQQDRMKTCNADAKGKTGDERKAFMSECLKK
jgi:psiF repeat